MQKNCLLACLVFVFLVSFVQAETYWATTVVGYYGTNAASTINNILGVADGQTTDVGTADGRHGTITSP